MERGEEASDEQVKRLVRSLRRLLKHRGTSGVRMDRGLAALDPEEQAAWRELWESVREFAARSR